VIKLSFVYGQGIENYMNDAPVDVATEGNPSNTTTPITAKALPVLGVVAFADLSLGKWFTTSFGYSLINIDNSSGQEASAFKRGHYALANLLYHPSDAILMGPEFQWGHRENFTDGWNYDDFRIQLSFKYSFSAEVAAGK
jgi:hypothetical protein